MNTETLDLTQIAMDGNPDMDENHYYNPFLEGESVYSESFQEEVDAGHYNWAKYSVIIIFIALFAMAAIPSKPQQAVAVPTANTAVEEAQFQKLELKTTVIRGNSKGPV